MQLLSLQIVLNLVAVLLQYQNAIGLVVSMFLCDLSAPFMALKWALTNSYGYICYHYTVQQI
jgi:hypothetical protein